MVFDQSGSVIFSGMFVFNMLIAGKTLLKNAKFFDILFAYLCTIYIHVMHQKDVSGAKLCQQWHCLGVGEDFCIPSFAHNMCVTYQYLFSRVNSFHISNIFIIGGGVSQILLFIVAIVFSSSLNMYHGSYPYIVQLYFLHDIPVFNLSLV